MSRGCPQVSENPATMKDSPGSLSTLPGESGVGSLFAYFIRHRTAANLLLLLLIIGGLISATKIRAQFFPDVVIESVTVRVAWPGAAPEEVDRAVVSRLEGPIRTVDGVDSVSAVSRDGSARITAEFVPGWDMAVAVDEVSAAVGDVADLPDEVEKPVVSRDRYRDRVTDIVISGPVSLPVLDQYAEELRARLFNAGVSGTSVEGLSDPVIRIETDDAVLQRQATTLEQIVSAIRGETGDWPVGEIDAGAERVRAESGRDDIHSLRDISIRTRPDGSRLRLSDVATVQELGLDRGAVLFRDGNPAVTLRVVRDADGDTLDLNEATRRVVEEMQTTLPQGVEVKLYRTRANAISARLTMLLDNGLVGLVIVLVLLFLFLSARTAFWVAAGIPAAMAGTVALMYVSGLTINMVSLFGMIICLGIIVDDAIVVGEHADWLHRQGHRAGQAALGAANKMAPPVMAASITTVIAFASLIFIGGRMGTLVVDLALTVCALITMSLIECFLILPAHMGHSLGQRRRSWIDAPSRWVNKGFDAFREKLFRPLVYWVVRLRYPVVAAALLMLAISVSMLIDQTVRWRFFSAPERGTITSNIAMLPTASREDTQAMLAEMDRALRVVASRYQNEHPQRLDPVEMSLAKLGGGLGRGIANSTARNPDLLGAFSIALIDPDLRQWSAFDFIEQWRSEIKRPALLDKLLFRGERSGPGEDAISIQLTGLNARELKAAAGQIIASLGQFSAVSGLEDDLEYDKSESIITVNARGESLGFDTASVARLLRGQLQGTVATTLIRGSRDIDIEVRLSESSTGAGYLERARLPLADGGSVGLSDVATVRQVQGFASVRRENGVQVANVTGEITDDAASRDEVRQAIEEQILPSVTGNYAVSAQLRGLAEQEREFLNDAMLGYLLCLCGIYLALSWIFASWSRPFAILLVIPFGFIGALWGHYFHGVPLSMFSVVGLIGLSGIIINDAIVLVTTIDETGRTRAMPVAIVEGTLARLRAVFLTTVTTVGGLGPLLLEQSRQALFLKPTVITLVYGLGFGVVIVLLITPSVIAIDHDIRMSLKSFRRAARLMTTRLRQTRAGQS